MPQRFSVVDYLHRSEIAPSQGSQMAASGANRHHRPGGRAAGRIRDARPVWTVVDALIERDDQMPVNSSTQPNPQ